MITFPSCSNGDDNDDDDDDNDVNNAAAAAADDDDEYVRERCKKIKRKKKLTNVSFMYVCVAGNGEMLVFFLLFSLQ